VAASTGNIAVATKLVELGANVKAVDRVSGHTAIHIAAENGDSTMVELLAWNSLRAVNYPDQSGQTPLHAAALSGAVEVALALLEAGGRCNKVDNSGSTPQDYVGPGHTSLFNLLSAHQRLERAPTTSSRGYKDVAPEDDILPPDEEQYEDDLEVLDVDECIDAFAYGTFEF
jgi:hypothetical protein